MLTFLQEEEEEEEVIVVVEEEDTKTRHDSGWEGCKR